MENFRKCEMGCGESVDRRMPVIIHVRDGLCNRLWQISTALYCAEVLGRKLQVLWIPEKFCDALFEDLFCNDWEIINDKNRLPKDRASFFVSYDEEYELYSKRGWASFLQTLRAVPDDRCIYIHKLIGLTGFREEDRLRMLRKIEIRPELQKEINSFSRAYKINKKTVGIHIRRTDAPVGYDDAYFIKTIDEDLNKWPRKQFFICSDDRSTEQKFKALYPKNVIIRDKSAAYVAWSAQKTSMSAAPDSPWYGKGSFKWKHDGAVLFRSTEAIREALVDLHILAKTDLKYFHWSSTFARAARLLGTPKFKMGDLMAWKHWWKDWVHSFDKRMPVPNDFDWKTYVQNYDFLQKAGIDSEEEAIRHWLRWGSQKGLTYKKRIASQAPQKGPFLSAQEICFKTFMDGTDIKLIEMVMISWPGESLDILEWGGGSARHFVLLLRKRKIKYQWVSVGHDHAAHGKAMGGLQRDPHVETRIYEGAGVGSSEYARIPREHDRKFDIIFIDGIHRQECLKEALSLLKPGGIVFLPDAEKEKCPELLAKYPYHQIVSPERQRRVLWAGQGSLLSQEHLRDAQDRIIYLTFTNFGCSDLCLNLVASLLKASVSPEDIFVECLDQESFVRMRDQFPACCISLYCEGTHKNYHVYESQPFNEMMQKKIQIINKYLDAGRNIFFVDADVVFMRDIRSSLRGRKKDIYFQCDLPKPIYCAGVMYVRNTIFSRAFFRHIQNLCQKPVNEQRVINNHIEQNGLYKWIDFLPIDQAPNGWVYYGQYLHHPKSADLVHNNRTIGITTKMERLKKWGLLFLDRQELHYDSPLRMEYAGPRFPPYIEGCALEEGLFRYYLLNKDKFSGLKHKIIPIYWTAYYHWQRDHKSDKCVSLYLDALDKAGFYFTVAQHADAVKEALPPHVIVFSAGGRRSVEKKMAGHVPIPLIINKIPPSLLGTPVPLEKRKYLFSFIGAVTHEVRARLYEKFANQDPRFYFGPPKKQSSHVDMSEFEHFVRITRDSQFVLCPRGTGPTSFRLYETLQLGAVPVYIYDEPWLPYMKELDWSEFCVLVHVRDVDKIPVILKGYSLVQIEAMLKKAEALYEEYFSIDGVCRYIHRFLQKAEAP